MSTLTNSLIVFATVIGGNLAYSFLQAYFKEAGKRLATRKDIDEVLAKVRAVTTETETIRAEINSGVWLKQWHLDQKRDCYFRLIGSLENIQLARSEIRDAKSEDPEVLRDAMRREKAAIEEFRRARAAARLMLSPKVVDGIGRLVRTIRAADPGSCDDSSYASAAKAIKDARDKVVELGRTELRFATDEPSG